MKKGICKIKNTIFGLFFFKNVTWVGCWGSAGKGALVEEAEEAKLPQLLLGAAGAAAAGNVGAAAVAGGSIGLAFIWLRFLCMSVWVRSTDCGGAAAGRAAAGVITWSSTAQESVIFFKKKLPKHVMPILPVAGSASS